MADWITDESGRIDLKSLTAAQMERYFVDDLGEKPFRARQVYKWLWQRGATTFAEMTDIAKTLRAKLEEVAVIRFLDVEQRLVSSDGTRKYLWRLPSGDAIESVLIPDGDRLTLCMSSQVGCAMACTFCLTGDLGLKANLKPSEIVNQALQVARDLPEDQRITNLVFMGMGEPLHNLDNLCSALEVLFDDHALNYSHRKVTVSTVGMVDRLIELANRSPVNLAVSLNASTEEQRRQIMPITKKWSLAELIDTCRHLPLPPGKRITFEYVMFRGFNDSLEDARRLYEMLQGVKAKVNLIPYNENPHRDIRRPSEATVKAFQHYFVSRNMNCTVRTTRGKDISAACGQLGKGRQQLAGSEPMVTETPAVTTAG